MKFSKKDIGRLYATFRSVADCSDSDSFFRSKGFSLATVGRFGLLTTGMSLCSPELDSWFGGMSEEFRDAYAYVIPGYDVQGEIDYLMVRRRAGCVRRGKDGVHKHLYVGDIERGLGKIYNSCRLIDDSSVVFIVESWTDALSLEEIGIPAVAMNRVANCQTVLKPLLEKHIAMARDKEYVVMCDSDNIGVAATRDISDMIEGLGLRCRSVCPYPGRVKDANEWLVADRQDFEVSMRCIVEGA